jgi:translation elongation factor EF-G
MHFIYSGSLGDVLSDITVKRRGQIREIINRDGSNISTILADAPLATMLGYATGKNTYNCICLYSFAYIC